jgi:hypothetical protein
MSYFFKENSIDGAKDTYEKSQVYKHHLQAPMAAHSNLIDFQNAEKYLYGRVSYRYVPIEVDLVNIPLVTLAGGTQTSNIQTLSFVADAFSDLRALFAKKSMDPAFDKGHPHLSTLDAAQGYVSPQTLYSKHYVRLQNSMIQSCRENNIRFANFEQFLRKALPIIKRATKTIPFTYPGFIKSKHCDVRVSGLVIELVAGKDFNNDRDKINDFVKSQNWPFYLNACAACGFSVDASNPWRLVADIGSSTMVDYAQRAVGCGFNTTQEILSFGYKAAHIQYYETFANSFLMLYNALKQEYTDPYMCSDFTLRSRVIKPPDYSLSQITSHYLTDLKLFDLYMEIRIIEDENTYSEGEIKRLKTRALSIARSNGIGAALNAFEIFVGQTYDYSGSLTDQIHRVKIVQEREKDVLSDT